MVVLGVEGVISRAAIQVLLEAGLIKVTPDPVKIGPNSIDLRLGGELKVYHPTVNRVTVVDPLTGATYQALDPKNPPPLIDVPKLQDGRWLLVPGQFYLGVTLEETYCRGVVPHLDGRSTCGRLSIEAHKTAGVGDNGFKGHWTLEIEVAEPVLVAPGDRLFQVYFTPAWGRGLALLLKGLLEDRTGLEFWQGAVTYQPPCLGKARPPFQESPLIELHDLYGSHGSHYQDSQELRGPAPLD